MRKFRIYIFVLIFNSFNLFSSHADARAKVVFAGNYCCPLNCHPSDPNPGYLIEALKKIFDIYGYDLEYVMVPWHEALAEARAGKINGVIGLGGSESGLVTTNYPVYYSKVAAFVREGESWVYDGLDSLKGMKITTILDYYPSEVLKEYFLNNYASRPNSFLLESSNIAVIDCINNLLNKRVDVYIEDENVFIHYIKKANYSSYFKNAGKVAEKSIKMHIALSSIRLDTEELAKMIDEGAQSLEATGDLKSLRKKYLILDPALISD